MARSDDVELVAVGSADLEGTAPTARDSIFRIASVSKPVTAAVLALVEDGRLALDAPVEEWLPEPVKPTVVRTPSSPVEDAVPADRPVTVEDLLSFRAGWGFPDDFSLPAVQTLLAFQQDGRAPYLQPGPDEWLGALSRTPMVRQPGTVIRAWLKGVAVSRSGPESDGTHHAPSW
ncbi:serine hydrolase domain-containing protein [Streptomyces hokutonensis]|uniref:serine hydrolase domain-containing protein n=1 Tax=Streptomyces hokutonensis TaxID=1306990 RepID=UPI0037FCB3CC